VRDSKATRLVGTIGRKFSIVFNDTGESRREIYNGGLEHNSGPRFNFGRQ